MYPRVPRRPAGYPSDELGVGLAPRMRGRKPHPYPGQRPFGMTLRVHEGLVRMYRCRRRWDRPARRKAALLGCNNAWHRIEHRQRMRPSVFGPCPIASHDDQSPVPDAPSPGWEAAKKAISSPTSNSIRRAPASTSPANIREDLSKVGDHTRAVSAIVIQASKRSTLTEAMLDASAARFWDGMRRATLIDSTATS
jgi:hypothetical protein